MPIREIVSQELFDKLHSVLNKTYTDFENSKSDTTIAMLLVHLYEVALVAYTLQYSQGYATYSIVKEHLPIKQTNQEFVRVRDDIVHNLYNIVNFKDRLQNFLQMFTKENFLDICEHCSISSGLYDELLTYSLQRSSHKQI